MASGSSSFGGGSTNHTGPTGKKDRRTKDQLAAILTAVALVWVLAALAGIYPITLVPAALLLATAAALIVPRVAAAPTRMLDGALLGCGAFVLLQAIPLPASVRNSITPAARRVENALTLGPPRRSMLPLTIDPPATWNGLFVVALLLLLFFVAREVCAGGGVRRLVRTVAWTGLVAAAAAVLLRPGLPGGLWLGARSETPMYGPFVNRNHMGTWLIMALPLVGGYILARINEHARRLTAAPVVDARMVWLAASAVVMLIGVVASLSRSAIVGAAAAAVCFGMVARTRRSARSRGRLWAAAAGVAAIVVTNSQATGLMARFQDSKTTATWSRAEIWRQTLPIVRDFPFVGVGSGAFRRAMLVYQQSDRALFFNQAHNQVLQLAAEGGAVLLLLLAVAAVALGRSIAAHLRTDRSPIFWIRAGAAAGIVGVLVQSLFETGLRMPANGLLFALLCAIASFDYSDKRAIQSHTPPFVR